MEKKILFIILLLLTTITWGQGLKTEGKKIVDTNGNEIILKRSRTWGLDAYGGLYDAVV